MKDFYASLLVRGYQRDFLIPALRRASREHAHLLNTAPFKDSSQIKKRTQNFVSFSYHVSSKGHNLKIYRAPMAPTLTTSATGASSLDAKKQTQNSHCYQLGVCGIQPPQKYRQYLHIL